MKLIPIGNVAPPAKAALREKPRRDFEIRAAASGEAEVLIYSEIGYWYIDPEWLIRDLMSITAPVIHVRINSPGGDVFGGVAIYNALVRHDARVIVHVDGLAASIASLIAMAGDEIHMSKGAFLMIHDPHIIAAGTAADLRGTADVLEKVAGSMAEIYAERSGSSLEQVQAWMLAETFFTAQDARAAGFADAEDESPALAAKFDLSMFAHAPASLREGAPAPDAERPPFNTVREFEAFLREEGRFSHAAARTIAERGFKASSDPREEDGGPDRSTTAGEPTATDDESPQMEALAASLFTARLRLRLASRST